MKNEEKLEQLITLVAHKSGVNREEIKMETSIEEDLGITGEDAEELIKEISKIFKIDISNFIFSKYFNDEPSIFNVHKEVAPFTVENFLQAIFKGRLD